MATYREQLEMVKGLSVREGETRRINCPVCGGNKTFTISRMDGSLVWNCYKASCNTGGGKTVEMSSDAIQRKIAGEAAVIQNRSQPIPLHLSNPKSHKVVLDYLVKVNSLEALNDGLITIKFAPAENRVLFFNENKSGAVGRALDRRRPKWRAYGETSGLLRVGTGGTGVVVEDAASACSVSRVAECSGCAILGTTVTSLQKSQLKSFDRVIIALDADASRKALKIKSQLEGHVATSVAFLEEDLKYVALDAMRERLGI